MNNRFCLISPFYFLLNYWAKIERVIPQINFFLLVFFTFQLNAQDPIFSQFYANRVYLNPAFTGIEQGTTFTTSYRSQWMKLEEPFKTFSASINFRSICHPHTGLGINVFSNSEGVAALKTRSVGGSYARILAFGKIAKTNIHLGFKLNYHDYRIDWDKLVFTDQLDAIRGIVNPSVAGAGRDKIDFVDFSWGGLWRQEWIIKDKMNRKRKFKTILGASLHHLLMPKHSLSETDISARLPWRITIHAGARLPITPNNNSKKAAEEKWYIVPNVKYETQGQDEKNLSETKNLSLGAYVQPPAKWPIYVGLMWQQQKNQDIQEDSKALVTIIGFDSNTLFKKCTASFGISYDLNIGTLANEYSGGVMEITMSMNFRNDDINCNRRGKSSKKGRAKTVLGCERFF